MTIRHCILSTLLIVLSISTVFGADWPQWRGPERDGVSKETGLLGQWPESGPKLAWKATGFGAGYSGVAISGDRIYTMGDEGSDCYAMACKLSDGQRVWRTKVGKAGAPGWGGFTGPRATPTVDGEMVYVIGQYGELVCLKAADGTQVWSKHFVNDFGGKLPEWGYSESVLIDGDNALCTPGGSKGAIIALNKTTGQTLWQTKDFQDPAHYSSLVLCEIGGVRQYVQLTAASVAGVAADGKVLWRADRKGKTAVIPTPIVKGNKVYVTSGYGTGSNLFEIQHADGAFTVKEVYANKSIANQHGGAVLVGDYVYGYCDAKGWVCQQFDTGEIKWSEKGQAGKGSLTYADGRLYLRCESKGVVALIEAAPDGYKETGRFVQPGFGKPQTWPHPVISGKKLYLRDQDQLLCYDISK